VASLRVRECYSWHGVSYSRRLAWIELICCSKGGLVVGWISRIDVGGSKVRGVSRIDFDEEGLFFTGDEERVFGVAYHLVDSRIS